VPDHPDRIRVRHLYPGTLNIYADRGNIAVLRRRAAWRGIELEVDAVEAGDAVGDAADVDIFYMGGGQDRDQELVERHFLDVAGPATAEALAAGAAGLFVCGGYQMLGRHYTTPAGLELGGIGYFDAHTESGPTRMIGNVTVRTEIAGVLAGFENHSGRTMLGAAATPLGRVLRGNGNDGGGFEGCLEGAAIGTYLHGPLLPRNPALADWLLVRALEHRAGAPLPDLPPLDDALERQAFTAALTRP
jgi:hypothetical protein